MRAVKRIGAMFAFGGLLAAVIFIGLQLFSATAKERPLRVAFLDVGQGDAIFIEGPNGVQVLVDGGPDNKVLLALGKLMDFGDETIDLVVATHFDADHIGGLIPVFEKYDIGEVLMPNSRHQTKTADLFATVVKKEKAKVTLAEAGQIVWLDQKRGIYLKIFSPLAGAQSTGNEASVVAELRYGETEFLLTGDIGKTTELALINVWQEELKPDILKVAHHGSKYSSTEAFLQMTKPVLAVISASARNSYGHPHRETLARFEKLKIPVLGTYNEGTIIFESDGKQIQRTR